VLALHLRPLLSWALKMMRRFAVINSTQLDPKDLEHLAWVAEGIASLVPESSAGRLLIAGLVRKVDPSIEGNTALELTEKGLAFIRSSDQ
jgi:hypothetical protein